MFGDKKLSVVPVGFSLMSSFMCATSMFGLSSENYLRGTQFMVINVSNIFGTPIVAYVFLPVFYKLGYLSVYQVTQLKQFLNIYLCFYYVISIRLKIIKIPIKYSIR